MKTALTIGIIGGMSPESTVAYYQHIIRSHLEKFGDHSYPRIIIASVSFQQFINWQHEGFWERIAEELMKEFQAVAAAGADFAILATNTMHKILPQINSPIPVLSIIDAVADYAKANDVKNIALTGTRFTMSDGFYREGLEKHSLSVSLPSEPEQERIHNIIYNELVRGEINSRSVKDFNEIAQSLLNLGADAVLLGCTELALLTQETSASMKLIDSTGVHADAALKAAFSNQLP